MSFNFILLSAADYSLDEPRNASNLSKDTLQKVASKFSETGNK
jgi:hypothetical protein